MLTADVTRMLLDRPSDATAEQLASLLAAADWSHADVYRIAQCAIAAMAKLERARVDDDEARRAVKALSYCEQLVAVEVCRAVGTSGNGRVVVSAIADRLGLSRSTAVCTLRKLAAAGAITSRSLGMKGTHVEILNPCLVDALRR